MMISANTNKNMAKTMHSKLYILFLTRFIPVYSNRINMLYDESNTPGVADPAKFVIEH